MKYSNRARHNLRAVYCISYQSFTGTHYEYVKARSKDTVKVYAEKEASANGAIVTDIVSKGLPKNLNSNESFTDLIGSV